VLQSLGDLADNLWTDEEQLGPQPELSAVGTFDAAIIKDSVGGEFP
jgi:hypothetical protein